MAKRSSEEIKEEYLRWLEAQIKDDTSSKSYWDLINLLFDTEFTWSESIPMDENRLVDARDLRVEFGNEFRRPRSRVLNLGPISFLEVLIGLSRRLAFIAGGSAPGWAWILLGNLELQRMTNPLTRPKQARIHDITSTVIERTYLPDGMGGFFPLAWPDGDQTRVELWYQLHAYVAELHPEH
jgi:hypothetical protein